MQRVARASRTYINEGTGHVPSYAHAGEKIESDAHASKIWKCNCGGAVKSCFWTFSFVWRGERGGRSASKDCKVQRRDAGGNQHHPSADPQPVLFKVSQVRDSRLVIQHLHMAARWVTKYLGNDDVVDSCRLCFLNFNLK
jgi:hypothetical protein